MEYGLIGEKLGHSFSKEIHTKYFGLDYVLKELPPDAVGEFLTKKEFKAINVTIPYKQTVIPYLDSINEIAKKIGAVNTIVNNGGKLEGYNTDFLGLKNLIEKSGVSLKGKKVLILGDGATSKTALAVAGALECESVKRVSLFETPDTITYPEAATLSDTQIIINTTPVGMYPKLGGTAIDIAVFPSLQGVFDVVYNPLRSQLVVNALNRGITATGGLYMLVGQAVYAAEKFTGNAIPTDRIDSIFGEISRSKENIVLVGMPGSGKTTVGKLLSEETGMEFIDTDDEIVKKNGNITAIFEEKGESGFRDIESEVIKQVSALQGKVIATGGGAILRQENIDFLKQNGRIYFLDRPLEQLVGTSDRPLSQNSDMLKQRYNERYGKYLSCCDKQIISNTTPWDAVKSIKEDFYK